MPQLRRLRVPLAAAQGLPEKVGGRGGREGLEQNGRHAAAGDAQGPQNARDHGEAAGQSRHEPHGAVDPLGLKHIGGGKGQRDRRHIADPGVKAEKAQIPRGGPQGAEQAAQLSAGLGDGGHAEGRAAPQQRRGGQDRPQQQIQAPGDVLRQLRPAAGQVPAGQQFLELDERSPQFHW